MKPDPTQPSFSFFPIYVYSYKKIETNVVNADDWIGINNLTPQEAHKFLWAIKVSVRLPEMEDCIETDWEGSHVDVIKLSSIQAVE